MVEHIVYKCLPEITGCYVHATKHNDTLYLSGLTAMGTDVQTLDLVFQAQEVLNQISEVLRIERRKKSDLVKLTVFVCDISKLGDIRKLLVDFYGKHFPACSLVEVSSLIHSDLQIEIEAVVAL